MNLRGGILGNSGGDSERPDTPTLSASSFNSEPNSVSSTPTPSPYQTGNPADLLHGVDSGNTTVNSFFDSSESSAQHSETESDSDSDSDSDDELDEPKIKLNIVYANELVAKNYAQSINEALRLGAIKEFEHGQGGVRKLALDGKGDFLFNNKSLKDDMADIHALTPYENLAVNQKGMACRALKRAFETEDETLIEKIIAGYTQDTASMVTDVLSAAYLTKSINISKPHNRKINTYKSANNEIYTEFTADGFDIESVDPMNSGIIGYLPGPVRSVYKLESIQDPSGNNELVWGYKLQYIVSTNNDIIEIIKDNAPELDVLKAKYCKEKGKEKGKEKEKEIPQTDFMPDLSGNPANNSQATPHLYEKYHHEITAKQLGKENTLYIGINYTDDTENLSLIRDITDGGRFLFQGKNINERIINEFKNNPDYSDEQKKSFILNSLKEIGFRKDEAESVFGAHSQITASLIQTLLTTDRLELFNISANEMAESSVNTFKEGDRILQVVTVSNINIKTIGVCNPVGTLQCNVNIRFELVNDEAGNPGYKLISIDSDNKDVIDILTNTCVQNVIDRLEKPFIDLTPGYSETEMRYSLSVSKLKTSLIKSVNEQNASSNNDISKILISALIPMLDENFLPGNNKTVDDVARNQNRMLFSDTYLNIENNEGGRQNLNNLLNVLYGDKEETKSAIIAANSQTPYSIIRLALKESCDKYLFPRGLDFSSPVMRRFNIYTKNTEGSNVTYQECYFTDLPITSSDDDEEKIIGYLRGPIRAIFKLVKNGNEFGYALEHIESDNKEVINLITGSEKTKAKILRRACQHPTLSNTRYQLEKTLEDNEKKYSPYIIQQGVNTLHVAKTAFYKNKISAQRMTAILNATKDLIEHASNNGTKATITHLTELEHIANNCYSDNEASDKISYLMAVANLNKAINESPLPEMKAKAKILLAQANDDMKKTPKNIVDIRRSLLVTTNLVNAATYYTNAPNDNMAQKTQLRTQLDRHDRIFKKQTRYITSLPWGKILGGTMLALTGVVVGLGCTAGALAAFGVFPPLAIAAAPVLVVGTTAAVITGSVLIGGGIFGVATALKGIDDIYKNAGRKNKELRVKMEDLAGTVPAI